MVAGITEYDAGGGDYRTSPPGFYLRKRLIQSRQFNFTAGIVGQAMKVADGRRS
jgi:hypothetical protein